MGGAQSVARRGLRGWVSTGGGKGEVRRSSAEGDRRWGWSLRAMSSASSVESSECKHRYGLQ